jgi:DNA-binding MarR family transcriptional regulator
MADSQPQRTTDLAILVTAASRCVADRLLDAMGTAGLDEVRSNHGFVIRALGGGDLTLTELAGLLGVSKQAAQKVVDDMERRGLVERMPSSSDRRAKAIRLTASGRKVRKTALATSKRLEAELRADLGDATVDAGLAVLERFVERNGGLEEVRAGRARPIW